MFSELSAPRVPQNTSNPDRNKHRKTPKRGHKTGPKTGSQKGSKSVKKWSYRGFKVDFDKKLLTRLTRNVALFDKTVKNTKSGYFRCFSCFDKTAKMILEREPFLIIYPF